MFRYVGDSELFSIKVGNGADTMAKFKISGPKAFRAFLADILKAV
jgi:trehalose-6-phosphatase